MSRLPEVGEYVRGTGKLVAIETIPAPPQPPPETDWIFERITARGELHRNGAVLDAEAVSTFWDFDGPETSVSFCVAEARQYCAKHAIAPESEVEVVVVRVVSYDRRRPGLFRENVYDRSMANFEAVAKWRPVPEPRESVVWSSRHPEGVERG